LNVRFGIFLLKEGEKRVPRGILGPEKEEVTAG
jgi:hypothetical protein